MVRALAGYTRICVISFIDLYPKVMRNFPEAVPVVREERIALGQYMIRTAREAGMTVRPCGEGRELEPFGADCRGCMTLEILENALGEKLRAPNCGEPGKNAAVTLPATSEPMIPAAISAGIVTPIPAGKR